MLTYLFLALLGVLFWLFACAQCTPFVLVHSTSAPFDVRHLCFCRHLDLSWRYPLVCQVSFCPCWTAVFLLQLPSFDLSLCLQLYLLPSLLALLDNYACRRGCLWLGCYLFESRIFINFYSSPLQFQFGILLLNVLSKFFELRVVHASQLHNQSTPMGGSARYLVEYRDSATKWMLPYGIEGV